MYDMYQQSYFHITLYHIVLYNIIFISWFDIVLGNMLHYGFVSVIWQCIAWYVIIEKNVSYKHNFGSYNYTCK